MKRFGRIRQFAYSASEWLYAGCTATAATLGWICSVDLDETSWLDKRPFVTRLFEILQDFSLFLYLIIGAILLVCVWYRSSGNPWVLEKLKFILDEYQAKAFTVPANSPDDHHRVTLFKRKRAWNFCKRHWSAQRKFVPWGCYRPFSHFLVPYMRSGHQSQSSSVCFYVCDSSDQAEGVAGQAWSANKVRLLQQLPEVNAGGTPRNLRKSIEQYANATNCSSDMIRKRYIECGKPLPRSIAAIPISVSGKIWGTLVLDSREPNGVNQNSIDNFQLTVALIGHLLEKA